MIIITNKDEQKNDGTLTIIKLTMTIIRTVVMHQILYTLYSDRGDAFGKLFGTGGTAPTCRQPISLSQHCVKKCPQIIPFVAS